MHVTKLGLNRMFIDLGLRTDLRLVIPREALPTRPNTLRLDRCSLGKPNKPPFQALRYSAKP